MSGQTSTRATNGKDTCPLRGLTLCDGLVLEQPDGALTQCPHETLADPSAWQIHQVAHEVLSEAVDAAVPRLPL